MGEENGDQIHREADIKNREKKYNPRLPVLFAIDPNLFKQEAPFFLRDTANRPPLKIEGNKTFNRNMELMHGVSNKVIKEFPQMLQNFIYVDFARQKDWMRTESSDGIEGNLPIPLAELNEKQTEEWERHKMIYEMPRADLPKLLRLGLSMWSQFPDVRYHFDDVSTYMRARLDQAQFQLVMKMLPDITNDEAKGIFSEVRNAEELSHLATKEIKLTSSKPVLDPQIIERFRNNLEQKEQNP